MTKKILIAAALIYSPLSWSQSSEKVTTADSTNESHTTLNDVLKNKKFDDNTEITDAKLKADSGSLSRYSLKFSLAYAGPAVTDLNNPSQPNPDPIPCVCETSLSGSVSTRYRIDSKNTIGVGTGVSALTPLQGVKRYDVKNPFISYDSSSKIQDVQVRNSVSVSAVTNVVYRNLGETSGIGFDNSLVYDIGLSRFAIGLDTSLSYYLFERGYVASDRGTTRYTLSLYPMTKYNFSDRFNVSTSLAMGFYNPRLSNDSSILKNKTLSQRLGVGYAFTREIYLSPFLNFFPGQFNTDTTTINFSTSFSVL